MKRGLLISYVNILLVVVSTWGCSGNKNTKDRVRPNVLFISIDDLNDWVGALGGYPKPSTPNIDRVANQGALFGRAYTAAPLCNPSRTAVLTGIHPYTSGIYENKQPLRNSNKLEAASTLPQYFRENGYRAIGSGKVFHYAHDTASWDEYWPSINKIRPDDPQPGVRPAHGMPIQGRFFDWAPLPVDPSAMGDWKIAEWVAGQLQKDHEKSFFLACGFYKPHLPWYIPQKYFDLHPLENITLPSVDENDLQDVPLLGRELARVRVPDRAVPGDSVDGDYRMVLKYDKWKEGVQAYLAAISFADDCLGKVLDALENSKYKDNTIVVLWSDHGYHLGEKLHWRKSTPWEEATRSLLVFKMPGPAQTGAVIEQPVSLVDIYPTLVDLCQLPAQKELEGQSLRPLLETPTLEWERPAITTFRYKNQTIRSKNWRYIRYADGTEELYDHRVDSLEKNNLAHDANYDPVKSRLAKWLPKQHAMPITNK